MSRNVLVTAGASGIGLEIARAFGMSGARVFVCDIDAGALQRAATEVPGLETAMCTEARRPSIDSETAMSAARKTSIHSAWFGPVLCR